MSRDLPREVRQLTARVAPGAAAEVYALREQRRRDHWRQGRHHRAELTDHQSVALRMLFERRIGFAAALGSRDPDALISSARVTAATGPLGDLTFPSTIYQGSVADPAGPPPVASDAVEELQRRILRSHPGARLSCSTSAVACRRTIVNTAGARCDETRSWTELTLTAGLARRDDLLELVVRVPAIALQRDDLDLAGWAIDRLSWTAREARLETADAPVILSPRAFAALVVAPLARSIAGRAVLSPASPFAGALGATIAHRDFSLEDDPTIPGAPRSRGFDDEGVRTARRQLVRDGRLAGYALDLASAAELALPPSGNGRRAWDTLPEPEPATLTVPAGRRALRSLLASWPSSVLVDDVAGDWYAGPGGTEIAAVGSLAVLFESGEPAGRLRDVHLRASLPSLLSGPIEFTAERRWVGSQALLPYAHLSGLTLQLAAEE